MIPWLESDTPFPPLSEALDATSPAPGLLAASEQITVGQLERAYRHGIFPWYSAGQPVLWWSTDPRMVLAPQNVKISRSLSKTIRRILNDSDYEIYVDANFTATMQACANASRAQQVGTWITQDIVQAYTALHLQGKAHAIELWHHGQPIGGLYGVALGRMFYGESMFTKATDASKVALVALCAFLKQHEVKWIDCQQETSHLASLGAAPISREAFIQHIEVASAEPSIENWNFDKRILMDSFA